MTKTAQIVVFIAAFAVVTALAFRSHVAVPADGLPVVTSQQRDVPLRAHAVNHDVVAEGSGTSIAERSAQANSAPNETQPSRDPALCSCANELVDENQARTELAAAGLTDDEMDAVIGAGTETSDPHLGLLTANAPDEAAEILYDDRAVTEDELRWEMSAQLVAQGMSADAIDDHISGIMPEHTANDVESGSLRGELEMAGMTPDEIDGVLTVIEPDAY